jgi:hypothetical protein
MKTIRVLLAGLLLAGLCWPLSASAQAVPPGSYLDTCGNAYLRGDTLVATCRRVDGYAERTSLPAVQSCVGDIGNMNGRLTCSYARARMPSQPDYGASGAPGSGREWEGRREHCVRMRERLHEIRDRVQDAEPWERDRLGTRMYAIRERLRHECWGHWREDE